jgi:hypothetical protein
VAGWRNGDDEKLMAAILAQLRQEKRVGVASN